MILDDLLDVSSDLKSAPQAETRHRSVDRTSEDWHGAVSDL
jgi:hypothetical protein